MISPCDNSDSTPWKGNPTENNLFGQFLWACKGISRFFVIGINMCEDSFAERELYLELRLQERLE